MNELDAVRLNFTPESLIALDVILAFVLFGVALDMRVADFKGILTSPRGTRCCSQRLHSRSRWC